MDDTQKMLQIIINGQSAIRDELSKKIEASGKSIVTRLEVVEQKVDQLDKKIDRVDKELNERLDKIGLQLAYLEDDAPTREEHDQLVKRVSKVEHRVVSA